MKEYISENELNNFLTDLKAAQNDGGICGVLGKGGNAVENLSKLNLHITQTLHGRSAQHICRLLEEERSDIEKEFALALVRNAEKIITPQTLNNKSLIQGTIGGEGDDCCLWWTLSPYIFDELKPKVNETKGIESVIEWSKTGRPNRKLNYGDKNLNLLGLDRYNYANPNSNTFILSENSNGTSHQFARKEAKRLVRDIFPKI